jgi:hypothetical protein
MAAANYSIPTNLIEGFAILRNLPGDIISKISEALSEFPVGATQKIFVETFSKIIPEEDDVEITAASVFSMGRLISMEDADLNKISIGLARAYFHQSHDNDEDGSETKKLASIILILLSSWVNAKKTFKAIRLLGHNERIYRKANIVTDIRLVFDDDLSNKNRSALIIHQMEIDYFIAGNESDEFFITMDTSNLQKLKEQINRALEKEQKIKNDYSGELNFISIGGEL